jgi:hypothetical protein
MIRAALSISLLLASFVTLPAQTGPSTPSFELASYNIQRDSTVDAISQGDFNNDGKPDLVVQGGIGPIGAPGSSEYGISVLLGNGDGTFQPPVVIGTTKTIMNGLTVADFNRDGNLDIISFTNNGFNVFYGNGNGTFQAALHVPTTTTSISGAVGNLFNDGFTDVAIADADGNIEIFKNEGGNSFVLLNTINTVAPQFGILQIQTGDLNGTGVSDIGVITTSAAYVLWNAGQGSFTKTLLSSYVHPVAINLNDVNQDGRSDILISYSCNNSNTQAGHVNPSDCAGIDVYYGQGNNQTIFRHALTDSGPSAPQNIFAADVNGDGIADLVASTSDTSGSSTSTGSSGLYVWIGSPDGSFALTPTIYNSGTSGGLVPGDWPRNGLISFAQFNGSGLQMYLEAAPHGVPQTSTISPTVTVNQPVNNTYFPAGSVLVQANAFDKNTVTSLQLYVDGQLDYSEPVTHLYTDTPALTVGPHQLVVKAWDYTGMNFRSNRNITVYNGTPTSGCPSALNAATICYPYDSGPGPTTRILANGWTANIPTAAQLYIDGKLVINNTNAGSSYIDTTQTLTPGSHNLVFKLWDAAGNVYTAQETHTVN